MDYVPKNEIILQKCRSNQNGVKSTECSKTRIFENSGYFLPKIKAFSLAHFDENEVSTFIFLET